MNTTQSVNPWTRFFQFLFGAVLLAFIAACVVVIGSAVFKVASPSMSAINWPWETSVTENTGSNSRNTIDLDSPEAIAATGTSRQVANQQLLTEMVREAPAGDPVYVACDEAAMPLLTVETAIPVAVLNPGEGAWLSMSPGVVTFAGKTFESSGKGAVLSFYNGSTVPLEVTVQTSWNDPNNRHDVHLCIYRGTPEQIALMAADLQGPKGGPGEGKDVYASYAVLDEGSQSEGFLVIDAASIPGYSLVETTVLEQ